MGEGSGIAVSCAVGRRHSSDPTLLWLWCRPAARARIQPVGWELTYASGAALKRPKEKKKSSSHLKICPQQQLAWCLTKYLDAVV